MPISAAVCVFQPGSVKSGGTWHCAQVALPRKSASPRAAAAASKLPAGGRGAGIASWQNYRAASFAVTSSVALRLLPKPARAATGYLLASIRRLSKNVP